MTGQLNEHPLGELIREIYDAKLSGALRLCRERAKAVVYFDSGETIYAASNLRAYRLLECVRRWGILSEQQLARVNENTSDLEFGEDLVKSGALSRESLGELIEHQVSEMLCHALLWTDGEWEFDPRVRLAGDVRVKVKMDELLMESARRLPVDFVISKFSGLNFKVSPEPNIPGDLALLPTEAFVLTRVDAPLGIDELLAVGGLPANEVLQVVYTLTLTGLLHSDDWPQALSPEAVAKARAIKAAPSKPVKVESKIESKGAQQAKVIPAPEEKRDEKTELNEFLARLQLTTNYYQMLGLVRPVNDVDIKRAYHSLAKRFHPDRFRRSVDDQLHARIESAFAQVAQAYETLKDKQSRAAYDSKLLKQEGRRGAGEAGSPTPNPVSSTSTPTTSKPPVTPPESKSAPASYDAEERFKQGLAALESGNKTLAITCLGEAARLVPTEPRYRAYYGRALAGEERFRRTAEAEMKAAVTLDAANSSYRVMLAELYLEIGLQRRAKGELEHALSIDPGNKLAHKLLDKLIQ